MIAELFKRWRDARAEAAAKRAEILYLFEAFLVSTKPLVPPGSKHPKAALYRHAWKRAVVLGIIYQQRSDASLTAIYKEFEKLAGEKYFEAAPDGLYGKASLRMGDRTGTRILEDEKQRLFPDEGKRSRIRPYACIYVGIREERIYVGQTVGPPELRWVQHRLGGTGPFKEGDMYVQWGVVEGGIDPAKLDELESYYIGFFNADKEGYNNTRGNDWRAYERGEAERKQHKGQVLSQLQDILRRVPDATGAGSAPDTTRRNFRATPTKDEIHPVVLPRSESKNPAGEIRNNEAFIHNRRVPNMSATPGGLTHRSTVLSFQVVPIKGEPYPVELALGDVEKWVRETNSNRALIQIRRVLDQSGNIVWPP